MARDERAILQEVAPCVFGTLGRYPVARRDKFLGLRMREQKDGLAIQSHHGGQTPQERQRRPPAPIFEVGDMARLDAQLGRELALRKPQELAPIPEYRSQSLLLHLCFSPAFFVKLEFVFRKT